MKSQCAKEKSFVRCLLALSFLIHVSAFASEPAMRKNSGQHDANICAKLKVVDYSDHDRTVLNLRELYQAGEFVQLDDALACLAHSSKRFQNGKLGASAVYWTFRRQMPAPGVRPTESLHVQRWKRERPNSDFAQFAELRLMYAMAWNARGSGFARSVSEEEWQNFRQGLQETERAILKTPLSLKNMPILQNLHLAVVQDAQGTETSPVAVFEEGVRRWPEYYDFYEVFLTRLVPKWGGSLEAVDKFITSWSEKRQSTEGDSMYARLYTSVIITGVDPYGTKLNWVRMKTSFDELVAKYPDNFYKNLAASFACDYRDAEYFKTAMKRISQNEINPAVWLRETDPATCMQKFK